MKAFLVYWHPEPKSFNAAMFHTAADTLRAAGHEVASSDLHAMGFDPVSGRHNFTTRRDPDYLKLQQEEQWATDHQGFAPILAEEHQKLAACDLMIWQFPLWWFGLPAMMKGWADRVLAMGTAYGGGRIYGNGVYQGKKALLSLTTGGPEAGYQKGGFNGDLQGILRPIHRGILQFTGFTVLAPQVVFAPVRQSDEERQRHLAAWAERLRGVEQEPAFEVGPY